MKQTENYQLNQWDGTDRILRTDFNADNAKVDSALQDLRKDVDAVESRAGAQLLKREYVSGANPTVSLSDINWTQWKAIHISVYPVSANARGVTLQVNGGYDTIGSSSGNTENSGSSLRHMAHVILYPLFDLRRPISAMDIASGSGSLYHYTKPYSDFSYLGIQCNDGEQLLSGSRVDIWGEK